MTSLLLLLLAGPVGAATPDDPASEAVSDAVPVLMGQALSPEEYGAWVVGYTDAMGLAWYRALARLDPDGDALHLERVLSEADAELDYALQGLQGVPAYAGDARVVGAARTYAADLSRTLHEGLPVLLALLSAPLPDDAGLRDAQAVWAAMATRRAEHEAALHAAQAAFAAARGARQAPSLVPWQDLPTWQGPESLDLPGPMTVVLAARRHNTLVGHQRDLVALWGRVATLEGLEPEAARVERAALAEALEAHRLTLQAAGPLAGQDGLRQAVLAYALALAQGLDEDRSLRTERLRRAHRAFVHAQDDYQAWWRFEDYLAWATAVRAGG